MTSILFFLSLTLGLPQDIYAQSPSGDVTIATNTAWASGNYQINSLTVESGATLTIAGGSSLNITGGLTVTGNSKIVLQGANTSAQVGGMWAGTGVTVSAATIEVDAGSTINADGQGYVAEAGPGGGVSTDSNGGSYGGVGAPGVVSRHAQRSGLWFFDESCGSGLRRRLLLQWFHGGRGRRSGSSFGDGNVDQ